VSELDTKEEEKRSFYAANFQGVNINPDPGSCGAENKRRCRPGRSNILIYIVIDNYRGRVRKCITLSLVLR
jgi:hypothetical protein